MYYFSNKIFLSLAHGIANVSKLNFIDVFIKPIAAAEYIACMFTEATHEISGYGMVSFNAATYQFCITWNKQCQFNLCITTSPPHPYRLDCHSPKSWIELPLLSQTSLHPIQNCHPSGCHFFYFKCELVLTQLKKIFPLHWFLLNTRKLGC